jgi:fatty-acyl-CoA synthase
MQPDFGIPQHLVTPTASAYEYPLLVGQLLVNALAVSPNQTIVYRGDRRFSYGQLRGRIGQLASMLSSLGVRRGATVAMMDWDSHRYLEGYFAIPMMGATLFTVNVRISPLQIAYTLNDSGAQVLIANADFLPLLQEIWGRLKHPPLLVVANDDGSELPDPSPLPIACDYERHLSNASTDFSFADIDERTRAVLFYTTGTTGDPKGVSYSHRQIVLHALTTATTLASPRDGQRLHREDVYMPLTPMFHVLAWGVPYVAVMLGLKIVLPGRYVPEQLLKLRRDEQVSFSHCVPTILQMLIDGAPIDSHALAGWKMMIGGSALSPNLCRAALARGIDVFSGYGMSETGPIVALAQLAPGAASNSVDDVRTRCMAGRPAPLVELRVVDGQMRDVPCDGKTQGEIVLRAPFLTLAYHGQPEASETLWAGGYLHTQDVAVMHANGYVQIVDRMKDVIKTGGEWVSSIEVEALINEVDGVQESAVIGVKDERWGERPMALIVRRPGSAVTVAEVREHLLAVAAADRVSRYAVPEATRIVFLEEMPKTSVGKLDKKRLRNWID